jgi:hypothetical protein
MPYPSKSVCFSIWTSLPSLRIHPTRWDFKEACLNWDIETSRDFVGDLEYITYEPRVPDHFAVIYPQSNQPQLLSKQKRKAYREQ